MEFFQTEATTLEKVILQKAATAQRPINGTLELLPLCNMNCAMCYIRRDRSEVERGGGLRTAEEWIGLGEEMRKAGVLFLLLTGGEPLLFPDFQILYLELKRMGMVLTINTNGTLLDEKWADFFGKEKPRRINITLYGADERAYEELCHYPGGFERTMRGIRLLKERGVDVKINGSVTKENCKDIERIYQIGRELEIPVHMDTYMLPGIRERGLAIEQQSRLAPEAAAAAELETVKTELGEEQFPFYVQRKIAQIENGPDIYPDGMTCMAGNCSFSVNWQGEMRPCVTIEEPSVSVFEIGFDAAWEKMSGGAKKFRLHTKCVKCRLRSVCKTCVASAWLDTGKYDGLPEYLCSYAKEYARLLYEANAGLRRKDEDK